MIIKNMSEFGKAVDELIPMQVENCETNEWDKWDWESLSGDEIVSDINYSGVRTKPTITYYRVYERPAAGTGYDIKTMKSFKPFISIESFQRDNNCKWLHDFKIESD